MRCVRMWIMLMCSWGALHAAAADEFQAQMTRLAREGSMLLEEVYVNPDQVAGMTEVERWNRCWTLIAKKQLRKLPREQRAAAMRGVLPQFIPLVEQGTIPVASFPGFLSLCGSDPAERAHAEYDPLLKAMLEQMASSGWVDAPPDAEEGWDPATAKIPGHSHELTYAKAWEQAYGAFLIEFAGSWIRGSRETPETWRLMGEVYTAETVPGRFWTDRQLVMSYPGRFFEALRARLEHEAAEADPASTAAP